MIQRLRVLLVLLLPLTLSLLAPGCGGVRPMRGDGATEAMSIEGALANRYVRAATAEPVLARLRISTRTPAPVAKGAINVALVIDTSGSMEGQPIVDARAASLAMMDALSDDDRLAVIVFHSRTEVLLPSTELDKKSRARARERIQAMKAEGTTDMTGGLRAALDEATKNLDPRGINRIVLLGDGVPNDETEIRSLAQSAASRGISITALGLGLDYNETLMGAVAQLSGGRFHYVKESSEVAAFFKDEVLRLEQVYAKNAVVDITPGPGVRIEGVIGQPISRNGQSVQIILGDISRTDKRDLVVRLTTDPRRDGAPVEILDATLRYTDPLLDSERIERRVFLGAHATGSADTLAKGKNPEVEDTAATLEAAAKTLAAIEMARSGNPTRAREALNNAADEAHRSAVVNGNAAIEAQARSIRALGEALPAASPSPALAPPAKMGASPVKAGAASVPPPAPLSPKSAHQIRAVHDEAIQHF